MAEPAETGDEPRQRVVKAPGRARRAALTPAPETDPSPEVPVPRGEGGVASSGVRGENDDRLRRDRPPHW
ncbi:hypothetical protein [Cryobacterium tepidiphilum]|uniref:Uncharacterized protein n=1 Tax=Cryobacterium tepidiphilum TaxID=2486026 RepID=A0A3M8KUL3_9MICO|nr:hypothetical protein [Cryobacterium tepidiphilum]RNE56997.1 hypothetical protein EEJ31_12620 [Cryobacterium tepidiphilum]